MFSLKPKPVLGQACLAVCFLLVLAVFEPAFAKSGGKSDLVHPELVGNLAHSGRGKNSLAYIKIDTASQYIGQLVEVPILIRNDVKFGGFELEVDFGYIDLTFVGAERGEALSDTTNGRYDWEYFSYRLLPCPTCPLPPSYRCILLGLYDRPDGYPGIPLGPNSDYVSLVVLKFMIANGGLPSGTFLPIIFEWEGDVVNDTLVTDPDCWENTFMDPYSDTKYASQDPTHFNPLLCPDSPSSSSLEFKDGGVYGLPTYHCGDINLNGITYELADWVLFRRFLLEGDSVLTDPEQQALNSDVNFDSLPWTIADLLYMCRVILHESLIIPCEYKSHTFPKPLPYPQNNADTFIVVSSSAHPGEDVSVPVWLSNSIIADGVTFKVFFDSTVLSVEGVDTPQTRVAGWEEIEPMINPGELFFFAHPDWWLFPHPPGIGPGKGTLIKINFRINANAPPGTFLPITFQTEPNRGHYNAYTDTIGLTLVQPPTISGWVFTDVISGDVNSDGIVDVVDLVYLINYLYMAGIPPSPMSLGDFTQDGEVNLGDVVALVNYLFRS